MILYAFYFIVLINVLTKHVLDVGKSTAKTRSNDVLISHPPPHSASEHMQTWSFKHILHILHYRLSSTLCNEVLGKDLYFNDLPLTLPIRVSLSHFAVITPRPNCPSIHPSVVPPLGSYPPFIHLSFPLMSQTYGFSAPNMSAVISSDTIKHSSDICSHLCIFTV